MSSCKALSFCCAPTVFLAKTVPFLVVYLSSDFEQTANIAGIEDARVQVRDSGAAAVRQQQLEGQPNCNVLLAIGIAVCCLQLLGKQQLLDNTNLVLLCCVVLCCVVPPGADAGCAAVPRHHQDRPAALDE
eukprot:SAG22_NODE_1705_length_3771_cov_1.831699_4_plen_131_part_00